MLTKYPVFSKEIVRMNSPHLSDGTEDKCAVSLTLGFIFSDSSLLFRYKVHLSVHQLSNHTADNAWRCQFGDTSRCCVVFSVFVDFVVGLPCCTSFDTLDCHISQAPTLYFKLESSVPYPTLPVSLPPCNPTCPTNATLDQV